jgi:hypothetical protein
LTNDILEDGIGRNDQTALAQKLEQCPKDVDGLAAELGDSLSVLGELVTFMSRTAAVLIQPQDHVMLLEERWPRYLPKMGSPGLRKESVEGVLHVILNLIQSEGKEALFSFEVGYLKKERELSMDAQKELKTLLFGLGKRKVQVAFVGGETRSTIEGLEFFIGEDS